MKNLSLTVIAILTAFTFLGCGEDGSNGINGTNGTNGVDGSNGINGVDGSNAASMYCTPITNPDDVQRVCLLDFRLGTWALDIYNIHTQNTSRLVICEGIKFTNYYAQLLPALELDHSLTIPIHQDLFGTISLSQNVSSSSQTYGKIDFSPQDAYTSDFAYIGNIHNAELVKGQRVELSIFVTPNKGIGTITKIIKNPPETCQ